MPHVHQERKRSSRSPITLVINPTILVPTWEELETPQSKDYPILETREVVVADKTRHLNDVDMGRFAPQTCYFQQLFSFAATIDAI